MHPNVVVSTRINVPYCRNTKSSYINNHSNVPGYKVLGVVYNLVSFFGIVLEDKYRNPLKCLDGSFLVLQGTHDCYDICTGKLYESYNIMDFLLQVVDG